MPRIRSSLAGRREARAGQTTVRRSRLARQVLRCAVALVVACGGSALLRVPEGELAPLLARAARARGLAFTAPVRAWAVPEKALPELLARETDRVTPPDELRRESALLQALGLAPAGFDLRESLLALESGSLAGFYSPLADRLYVVVGRRRGGVAQALASRSSVLIHELGHALQAQHSKLLRVALGVVSEQDLLFALSGLLEGDALFTQLRDMELEEGIALPSPAAFSEQFDAQQATVGRGIPRFVRESVLLPYPTGYRLVHGIVDHGGIPALDEALADPPLSSAELLHPARGLGPWRPRPLTTFEADPRRFAPAPDCRPVVDDTLGELGLRSFARAAGLDAAGAERVADGWDADHAWLLDCSGRPAVAWLIALVSPARARELAAALEGGWADGRSTSGLGLERRGQRVLLSSGLSEAGRRFLTQRLPVHRYADLEAWLEAHPQVMERSRRMRAGVAADR